MFITTFFVVLLGLHAHCSYSPFLELSDNFLELRKHGGNWLIKFYAPWCAHCIKLEPVWLEVGNALSNRNVRVARIDCSQFPSVAVEFEIRGYPTIKFITPDSDYTFNGERYKNDIIQFVDRLSGPSVQIITSPKDVNFSESKFFVYVGELKGDLWELYYNVSNKFRPYAYFYAMNEKMATEMDFIANAPSIFVYRESEQDFFKGDLKDKDQLKKSLNKWLSEEKFDTFQKVSHGNLNEIIQLHRYVVLVVVDEKVVNKNRDMFDFRKMVLKIILANKKKYHKRFLFGWIGSPDLANSIALKVLTLPHLIVLNSTNQEYYIPDVDCLKMTSKDVETFLEKIYTHSVPSYGGNDLGVRIYRTLFESTVAMLELWEGNPLVASLLFAIPLLFVCFMVYSLFYVEIIEADEEFDEDEIEDEIEDKEEENKNEENVHLKKKE